MRRLLRALGVKIKLRVIVNRESVCAGDDARMYGAHYVELVDGLSVHELISDILQDSFFAEVISHTDHISIWVLKADSKPIAKIWSQNGQYAVKDIIESNLPESIEAVAFRFESDMKAIDAANIAYRNKKLQESIRKSITRNRGKRAKRSHSSNLAVRNDPPA